MQSQIQIPVNKQYIISDLFVPNKKTNTGIIFVHGWSSTNKRYVTLGKTLSEKGILSLAINLRGHANSPFTLDQFSRKDHLDDVISSIDYLKKQHGLEKIVLLGKSYGGYLSSVASTQRDIDYLILSHPALYPDNKFDYSNKKFIVENPNAFRIPHQSVSNNKALRAVGNFENPILLIESEKDEEIPQNITSLYRDIIIKKKNGTSYIIPNADHSLTKLEYLNNFYRGIETWLQTYGLI